MTREMMAVLLLLVAPNLFADTSLGSDPNSPIVWIARYSNNLKAEANENTFNNLLRDGFSNEKLKLKCVFSLEKGFSKKIRLKKETVGGEYTETLYARCNLNGLKIEMDPIGCTKSESRFNDYESQGLDFDQGHANFHFICSVKE